MVTHKHHIIPRYEGGSDDPSNLVELTVVQHAMWHFAEWQRKGNLKDKCAWKMLCQAPDFELASEIGRMGGRASAGVSRPKSKGRSTKHRYTEEVRKKMSESAKKRWQNASPEDLAKWTENNRRANAIRHNKHKPK